MRKLVLLVGLCMLGVMSFGTLAWAQDPCPDPNYPRYTPDGCQASDLPDVVFGPAASATPTATATPGPVEPLTAAPAATATAAPTATATATAAATGDPTGGSAALPETGGLSALSLAALGLLVAGGLLARRLVRS